MAAESLPKYIVRSRDTLFFRRRQRGGGSAPWIMLKTQFQKGDPIPKCLHDEIEQLQAEWSERGTNQKPKPIISADLFFQRLERGARSRAKKAGRRHTLPAGWAAETFERQEARCHATGLPIRISEKKHDPWAASIERLDPSQGYTPENCVLTCYIYNCAKNQFSEADLTKLCRAIVRPKRK